jgi:hypothetical protein
MTDNCLLLAAATESNASTQQAAWQLFKLDRLVVEEEVSVR